jgi:hypothetical protein
MFRVLATGLAAAAAGCIALAAGSLSSCITAPPPDLPRVVAQRPTILQEAVVPPTDQILTELPDEFVVPVVLEDPDQSFEWDVYVDYNPCEPLTSPCQASPPVANLGPRVVSPTPGTLDGGVVLVSFPGGDLTALATPSECHRIDFLVAHAFNNDASTYSWDSIGGDIATWFFNPGGGPSGCPVYDAGKLQDGAFLTVDAGMDGLPLVPESGQDP